MASSKFPFDYVPVPENLIQLSRARPQEVACNLRPEQRPEFAGYLTWSRERKEEAQRNCYLQGDGFHLHDSVRSLLRGLAKPSLIAIHFQGYDEKVGTVIVELKNIYWAHDLNPLLPYARLDFEHPSGMESVNGCPNFWGAFILAVACAPDRKPSFIEDPTGDAFARVVRELNPVPSL
jgi:hypothetical protein